MGNLMNEHFSLIIKNARIIKNYTLHHRNYTTMTHNKSEGLWCFKLEQLCVSLFIQRSKTPPHTLRWMNMDVYLHNNSWFNNTRFAPHWICIWHKICLIMADHSRSQLAIEREERMNPKWSCSRAFFLACKHRKWKFLLHFQVRCIKFQFWGVMCEWTWEIRVGIFASCLTLWGEMENQNHVFY